jgi:hypothetical protein
LGALKPTGDFVDGPAHNVRRATYDFSSRLQDRTSHFTGKADAVA